MSQISAAWWNSLSIVDREKRLEELKSKRIERRLRKPHEPEGIWARADRHRKSKLDPMIEPYWTLGMVAAWIIWRDLDEVRPYWAEASTRTNPDSVTTMLLYVAKMEIGLGNRHLRKRITTRDVFKDIFRKAGEGKIVVKASADGVSFEPIEPAIFSILKPPYNVFSILTNDTGTIQYRNPVVARDQVISAWPPTKNPQSDMNQIAETSEKRDEAAGDLSDTAMAVLTARTMDPVKSEEGNPLTPAERDIVGAVEVLRARGELPPRASDRDKAIQNRLKSTGRTVPTPRTIQRALGKMRLNATKADD